MFLPPFPSFAKNVFNAFFAGRGYEPLCTVCAVAVSYSVGGERDGGGRGSELRAGGVGGRGSSCVVPYRTYSRPASEGNLAVARL
jgi:hypothetical protein